MAEEIKLLQAAIDGNTSAFEQIVIKYQPLVCAITFSGTGRVDASEELAQETFLSAWKNLHQLKEFSGFRAWLCTIARNTLNNYYRKKKPVPLDSANLAEISDDAPEPSETMISQEEHIMLEQALMRIPTEYREPLVMYYRQEKSTREVAVGLGLNESTVRTRLYRAKQLLREEMAVRLERTLERTAPNKTFTKAVMIAVGTTAVGISASASAASCSATGAATAGTATGLATIMSTITAKIITAAAVVTVTAGAVFAYKHLSHSDQPTAQFNETKNVQEEKERNTADERAQGPADVSGQATELNLDGTDNDHNDITSENQEELVVPIEPLVLNTVQMAIRVFDDETEQPLAGATLRVNRGCGCNCEPDYYTTDDKGVYNINFGEKKPEYISILVSKDGHVPQMFAWRDEMLENLEKEFSFFLPKGNKIGGHVENERGERIASAEVIFSMYVESNKEYPWTRIDDHVVKTDPNGQWVCDIFPQEPQQFSVKLRHPDYADTKEWINEREYKYEDFYNLKSALVMKDGVLLSGLVVDENGLPIKNATVFTGEDRFDDESPKTKTDVQGRFEFSHFLPRLNNRIVLTVKAKGYAPELEVIPMRDEIESVTVTLGQPNTIRVRVVDSSGNPIVGAGVDVDNWRSFRSLKWTTKTDAEGRFVWNNAPADEVDIDIYKKDFLRISEQFIAREEEYEIVMLPPLQVSGTVVDAETKEPIPYFTATRGIQWESGSLHWQDGYGNSKDFTNGQYEFSFTSPYPGHLVRIDAEGYLPAKSRVFDSNEATVSYDFMLEKGTGPSGVVHDPNGLPVVDAEVYVIMERYHVSFDNGKPSNEPDKDKYAQSDIDGSFSFNALLEDAPYKLVVMHDDGFAEVTKEQWQADPNIYLQKWGRIEGTLYSGLRAEANQGVHLSKQTVRLGPDDIDYYYSANTTTNDEGQFIIERAIPGKNSVGRRIKSENGRRWSSSGNENIEVISGQTVYVDLGGGGRTVIGMLIKPEWATGTVEFSRVNPNLKDAQNETVNPYEIYEEMNIEFPMPEAFDEMTVAEVMQWFQKWAQSDEGRALQKEVEAKMRERGINQNVHYNVMVEADGSFRILDVPPGDYILTCDLRKAREDGYADHKEPVVAEIDFRFSIVDITEENQDIPVELGLLEFYPVAKLEPGHPVPDFTVYSEDGKALGLTDFQDRYLLLTFYTIANEAAAEDMKTVSRIGKDFADDQRFAMMGVTHGGLPLFQKLVPKYLAEFDLTWQQGFIDGRNYEHFQTFGIQSWPQSFLIAPDGTLITNTLKGDQLYEAVLQALSDEVVIE